MDQTDREPQDSQPDRHLSPTGRDRPTAEDKRPPEINILEILDTKRSSPEAPITERYRALWRELDEVRDRLSVLSYPPVDRFPLKGAPPAGEPRPRRHHNYRARLIWKVHGGPWDCVGLGRADQERFFHEVMGARTPWECSQEECRDFAARLDDWRMKLVDAEYARQDRKESWSSLSMDQSIQMIREAQEHLGAAEAIWLGQRDQEIMDQLREEGGQA